MGGAQCSRPSTRSPLQYVCLTEDLRLRTLFPSPGKDNFCVYPYLRSTGTIQGSEGERGCSSHSSGRFCFVGENPKKLVVFFLVHQQQLTFHLPVPLCLPVGGALLTLLPYSGSKQKRIQVSVSSPCVLWILVHTQSHTWLLGISKNFTF